jgi:pimeloyl-ACP methyl ester carboxylesterase
MQHVTGGAHTATVDGSRRHARRRDVGAQRAGSDDTRSGRRPVGHVAWHVRRSLYRHLYPAVAAGQLEAERYDPALESGWRLTPCARDGSGRRDPFRHSRLDSDYLFGHGLRELHVRRLPGASRQRDDERDLERVQGLTSIVLSGLARLASGRMRGGHGRHWRAAEHRRRPAWPDGRLLMTAAPVRAPKDARRFFTIRRDSLRRITRRVLVAVVVLIIALTAASFGYNLATDGPVPRPAGLQMINASGFDTRFRSWGTTGSPVVLVPGAFETADTFAALGAELGTDHRVFAIDLTGTGYSAPSPPFDARHLADQLLAFLTAMRLTGANAPVLVGHSSGAAVVGMAALRGRQVAAGVVFLDGDATPLPVPSFAGWLVINPYRTSILRLALSSGWLIRRIYSSQCGPACPRLTGAGVETWRRPLQQPGFAAAMDYTLHHGIPSMTSAQLRQLRAEAVPKRVIFGAGDPQLGPSAAAAAAARIGAPRPTEVPGRHLTMISSPRQVAAAIRALILSISQ